MNEFQEKVVGILADHGPVWIVGGAVRDQLLGVESRDIDLVSKMAPGQVEDVLRQHGYSPQQIGMRFQTLSVFQDQSRVDIVQISDLEQDAMRRDFTINAIYQDPQDNRIIDPLSGGKDLSEKILRACGKAEYRFREDPVRILRMIKFAVKIGLHIDPETWNEAQELTSFLVSVPRERITAELAEILVLDEAEKAVNMLSELGYWDQFVPELARLQGIVQNEYHSLDVWEHTMGVFRSTPNDLFLRLAGLFHDTGKWEVASRECYLGGVLEFRKQTYFIEGYKIIGTRGSRELEYKLKPYIGQPVKILGARLDQYPETVQLKRILTGEKIIPGLERVPNGKRHFLNHEIVSARLTEEILKRYTFSMFFEGKGQKREEDLLKLIENHMRATMTFMDDFRGKPSRKSLKDKAAELVWDICWNGRHFELQHVYDFIHLWKADFHAGKVHSGEQNMLFETIMAMLIETALWQNEQVKTLDWSGFNDYIKEVDLNGKQYGLFKAFVTGKAMKERTTSLDKIFFMKAYADFRGFIQT